MEGMRILLSLALVLWAVPTLAQDKPVEASEQPEAQPAAEAPEAAPEPVQSCQGGVCVPKKDMGIFLKALKEKKCLKETLPEFELDEITIIVDKDGRIFFSGADPKPYTVKMKWCSYEVTGKGKVNVIAAMMEPPTWGFRFRPKAYMGALPLEMLQDGNDVRDGIDAGLMLDFFYYQWVNANVAAGYRSVGAGVGFDITQNFGAYVGYALAWDGFDHGLNGALWFGF